MTGHVDEQGLRRRSRRSVRGESRLGRIARDVLVIVVGIWVVGAVDGLQGLGLVIVVGVLAAVVDLVRTLRAGARAEGTQARTPVPAVTPRNHWLPAGAGPSLGGATEAQVTTPSPDAPGPDAGGPLAEPDGDVWRPSSLYADPTLWLPPGEDHVTRAGRRAMSGRGPGVPGSSPPPGAGAVTVSVSGRAVGGAAGLVGGGVLTFFAVVWLSAVVGIGFVSGAAQVLFDDSLVETDGRVVDLERSRTSDGDVSCRPVIDYRAPGGRLQTFTAPVGESPCRRVGESVRVHVDPDDPTRVYIDPFSGPVGLILPIFGVIGVVVLVVGLGTLGAGGVTWWRARGAARASASDPRGGPPPVGPPSVAPGQRYLASDYGHGRYVPGAYSDPGAESATGDESRPGGGPGVAPPLF